MVQKVKIERVRNIGIMAHIDAGKTTTTERILFYTGKSHRMGEVHDGAASYGLDGAGKRTWYYNYHVLQPLVIGRITRLNIIDTPGHVDFTVEVERSLRILDGAVALFCAVGGVEPQSETVWRQADKYNVPRIAFINKVDRVGADFYNALQMMKDRLKANAVPINLPIGQGDMFVGVIDLIHFKARMYHEETFGATFDEIPIPQDLVEIANKYRTQMLEAVSDVDDTLLEKYLDGKEITPEEILAVLRKATIELKIIPVLCGSAFKNKGVQKLLDYVVDLLPSPIDFTEIEAHHVGINDSVIIKIDEKEKFAALAFKIMNDPFVGKLCFFRVYAGTLKAGSYIYNPVSQKKERIGRLLQMHANHRADIDEVKAGDIAAAVGLKHTRTGDTLCSEDDPIILEKMTFPEPVIQIAIEPKTKADQDKLSESLGKLSDEDPTFRINVDQETGQTLISGMGELHLEILVDRMKREFKVEANIGKPQVAFRETITQPVKAEGKFIKQSGGRGKYGHVEIELEPNESGKGFEFINGIVGGSVPKEYIPAVSAGIQEAMRNGVVAGFPVVDVKAKLYDGSYHDVDSDELSFKVAGSMAFKNGSLKAKPILLEPIMAVEVVTPEDYLGDVMGDLNSRRGKIEGFNARKDAQVIKALVPLSEMFGYATILRSMTQGRAIYSMQFDHYQQVPQSIAEEIAEKSLGKKSTAV